MNKLPEADIGFWVIKLLATALGEVGGDADAMTLTLGFGYLAGTAPGDWMADSIGLGYEGSAFLILVAALNRKNALFAGSDGGCEHWAVIASLIETCKLVGVEPQAYLADVITRIVDGHPQRHLDDLLPWAYPSTPILQAVA